MTFENHLQNSAHIDLEHYCNTFKWRPPSLSELTPIMFNMEISYLGSEASKYHIVISIFK